MRNCLECPALRENRADKFPRLVCAIQKKLEEIDAVYTAKGCRLRKPEVIRLIKEVEGPKDD